MKRVDELIAALADLHRDNERRITNNERLMKWVYIPVLAIVGAGNLFAIIKLLTIG